MTTSYLAYFPSPPRGVWHLGPVPIRAYAVFIVIGIVVALLVGDRRWEARGGERGVIYDIALWAVPFGLIGGRLYHLSTDWRTYFGNSGAGLGAALRIWDGGLGIWGAVALGGVGAWIGCRRRGIPLPAFGDAVAPGIVLAQAIGRLGNYFNQELYGRETTMPWGLEIFKRRDPSGFIDVHSLDGVSTGQVAHIVQPTFLYEMLWNILIFVVLIYLDRRFVIGHGRLFAAYVAGYCVGRFTIELLRDDAATHIAGIRINSFTSTFVFIGAVVYIMLAPKGREDPASLRGVGTADVTLAVPELASVGAASGAAVRPPGGEADGHPEEPAAPVQTIEPEGLPLLADEVEAGLEPDAQQPLEPAEEPEEPEPEAVGEAVVGETEVEAPDAEEAPEPEAVLEETQAQEPAAEEESELAPADEAVAPEAAEELEELDEPEPDAVGATVVGETEVEAPDAEEAPEPEAGLADAEESELDAADEAVAPEAANEPEEPEAPEPEAVGDVAGETEVSDEEPAADLSAEGADAEAIVGEPEPIDGDTATEAEPAEAAEGSESQQEALTDGETQPEPDEPKPDDANVDTTDVQSAGGSRRVLRRFWRRRR